MFRRKKTSNKSVTGKEVIEFLENFEDGKITSPINLLDIRSYSEDFFSHPLVREFSNKCPEEVIDYIYRNFSNSSGKHKTFYDRKRERYFHKIELWPKICGGRNNQGPLELSFYTDTNL